MTPCPATVSAFQQRVLLFYAEKGRDLPWRKTADPYAILVSEIMLQQTQVGRVISYYGAWLQKWPTVHALASAPRYDILQLWSGLGYNRRAVSLHKAAQKIVAGYSGDVLAAMKGCKRIPGVGPYTRSAVRIFAANENIVTVDTNIRRILLHEFKLPLTMPDKKLWLLAEKCLPRGQSRDWHNALMDYGAMLLTARRTGIRQKALQSAFEGSDRQLRGKLVRHFLGSTGEKGIAELLSFVEVGNSARLKRILDGMVRDSLLVCRSGRYSLAS